MCIELWHVWSKKVAMLPVIGINQLVIKKTTDGQYLRIEVIEYAYAVR